MDENSKPEHEDRVTEADDDDKAYELYTAQHEREKRAHERRIDQQTAEIEKGVEAARRRLDAQLRKSLKEFGLPDEEVARAVEDRRAQRRANAAKNDLSAQIAASLRAFRAPQTREEFLAGRAVQQRAQQ